ncbi:MAG: hypothetical protein EP344_03115 [Bacteroidetes bacterium]|nr:MAG: hypothetical protein EP344_03115 [Bacteroidota bacterium]
MKSKFLNLGLILSSLIGYLKWGTDQSMFLFEGERDILVKLFTDPVSVLHPFVLLPLFGQVLLLVTLFQKEPGIRLTYIGMACIGILLLLIFLIGLMNIDHQILLSATPFLVLCIWTIRHHRAQKAHR